MLNEPTYHYLVRDFWVRTEVFYEDFMSMELSLLVENDSSLKGNNREEVVLKKFEEVEIRQQWWVLKLSSIRRHF